MEKIETPKVDELKTPEKPVVDLKVEGLKVKKRPKKLVGKVDNVVKIDFDKTKEIKEENAIQESTTTEPMLQDAPESVKEGKETKVELQGVGSDNESSKEVTPIQEITKDEVKEEFTPTPIPETVITPDRSAKKRTSSHVSLSLYESNCESFVSPPPRTMATMSPALKRCFELSIAFNSAFDL